MRLLLQVAKPRTVMNILKQAYGDNKAAVNDELVQCVLEPGLQVRLDRQEQPGGCRAAYLPCV